MILVIVDPSVHARRSWRVEVAAAAVVAVPAVSMERPWCPVGSSKAAQTGHACTDTRSPRSLSLSACLPIQVPLGNEV